ncbi:hypothetical protein C8J56DRAFT_879725 [Mycena floridula]|nr:hypothetical protein C8J56DRAFT_879725 [Mycena floridula]
MSDINSESNPRQPMTETEAQLHFLNNFDLESLLPGMQQGIRHVDNSSEDDHNYLLDILWPFDAADDIFVPLFFESNMESANLAVVYYSNTLNQPCLVFVSI